MNKRFLALILSLLMMFSVLNIPAFANHYGFQDEYEYTTNDYITNDQLYMLNKLGISRSWSSISELGSRHDEPITRHFMAWYTVLLSDIKAEYPSSYETLFKDLSSEHEYYSEIKAVVNAGYMNGDGDGYFRPNDLITTREAATVLLRVLGYAPYIDVVGVDKILLHTELLDGLEIEETITQAKLLRMIFNALNSPALKSTAYELLNNGDVDISYVIDESYLGFEHLFGIKHEIGILDATPETTLISAGSTLKSGQIAIAGTVYAYDGNAEEFLGYKVNYFYRDYKDDTKEIVYIHKSDKNEELVLTHDVINGFASGVYSYDKNNSTKRIALSNDTRVIFNGIASPSYPDDKMAPAFGKVTFINTDSDSSYEVVKVDSYEFYISSKIDETNEKIYTETYNNTDIIDLSTADSYKLLQDGSEVTFDKVRNGNLMAVRRSLPGCGYDKITIDVSKVTKSKVEVSAIKDDTFVAGKDTYTQWKKLKDYVTIKIGKIYNLYVFEDQVVAVIEGDVAGLDHAYLMDFGITEKSFSTAAKIASTDTAGNYLVYDVAEKVYIDGTPFTDMSVAKSRLLLSAPQSAGYTDSAPVAQPVMLGFNKDGQVNKIDTYVYAEGTEDEMSLQQLGYICTETTTETDGSQTTTDIYLKDTTVQYESNNPSLYYTAGGAPWRHIANVPTSVTVLFVPGADRFNKDEYRNRTFIATTDYKIDISNLDKDSGIPDVVYVYETEANAEVVRKWSSHYLIADLYEELNADGDLEYIVKAYQQGNLVNLTCDADLFAQLSVGDIWSLYPNKNNHITYSSVLFEMNLPLPADEGSRKKFLMSDPDTLSGATGAMLGTVMHSESGFLKIAAAILPTDVDFASKVASDDYDYDYFTTGSATVFKYSNFRGVPTIEKTGMSDIVSYTQNPENPSIVLLSMRGKAQQVIIIEQ